MQRCHWSTECWNTGTERCGNAGHARQNDVIPTFPRSRSNTPTRLSISSSIVVFSVITSRKVTGHWSFDRLLFSKNSSTFEIGEHRRRSLRTMFCAVGIASRCNAFESAQSLQSVHQGTFPLDERSSTSSLHAPTDETLEPRVQEDSRRTPQSRTIANLI